MDGTAFERVQAARDPNRTYSLDIFERLLDDFVEVHGDRRYADDPAIICGFAKLGDRQIAVIGHQKGRDINSRRHRNFAMAKPEGYRKALRLMKMAEKFGRPVVCFVDTPGAYPGIDAEERGQAEAIALNLREMAGLRVPIVVLVLGEGGSGGALAIGVGDHIIMMENAVYSVITAEGCAAILWKDAAQAPRAAECLRLTAKDLKEHGLADEIIPETKPWQYFPELSAEENADFYATGEKVTKHVSAILDDLTKTPVEKLLDRRYEKFRNMGRWLGE